MAEYKDVVIVTGSTGFIGSALINKCSPLSASTGRRRISRDRSQCAR
jgi:nucleoside-diphosphate-sugar epimerase